MQTRTALRLRAALTLGVGFWLAACGAAPAREPDPEAVRTAAETGHAAAAREQGCREGSAHCPGGLPDRVVLTPGADPSREMSVAWRTDARQAAALARLAPAVDGPTLSALDVEIAGRTRPLRTENGVAHFHEVRFRDLQPDTVYAYRVRGADGWSEWFQFRTAAAGFRPFRAIYFGDVQNDVLEHGARVVRQALQAAGPAAVVLHAGDLVQQRDGGVHDDEWGEWARTGAFHFGSVPQVVVAGNHEYLLGHVDGRERTTALGPHWELQFALPGNGVPGLEATTYHLDYQGVRFVVLDGTSALNFGTAERQAEWLDRVLAAPGARWKVVLMHQPLYPCARQWTPEAVDRHWRPLFERHRVDLVLQGHDHCYSRVTDPVGGRAAFRDGQRQDRPVYVASIVGRKMYALNERARRQTDRVAEDTQLYQYVDFAADRIAFRAYTATGRLYDAFELRRDADGTRRVFAIPEPTIAERTCNGERGPDGERCTSRRR